MMAVPALDVIVGGSAAGLTAPVTIALPWKERVAAEVARRWSHGYLEEDCAVHLTFNLTPGKFKQTAVFNLLKSTIDGLSEPIFAPGAQGHKSRWNRQDWRITELTACKEIATQEPSVRIAVGSPSYSRVHAVDEAVAVAFVAGEPPLFPGDQAGTNRVLQWREDLKQVLRITKPLDKDARLAIDLRFITTAPRIVNADLDNLCIPTVQAIGLVLLGTFSQAYRLVEVHATKEITTAENPVGTHVGIWQVQTMS